METPDRILHEAIRLFEEYPRNKVSMVDVAAAVGVSGPALYRYFRNKDDLYYAALEADLDRLFIESLKVVKDLPSPHLTGQAWLVLAAEMPKHALITSAVLDRDPRVLDLLSQSKGSRLVLESLEYETRTCYKAGIFRTDVNVDDIVASGGFMMSTVSLPLAFAGKYNTPEWYALQATGLAACLYPLPDWTQPGVVAEFIGRIAATGVNPVLTSFFENEVD